MESQYTVSIDVSSCLASNTGVGVCVGKLVETLTSQPGPERFRLCALSIRRRASAILREQFPGSPVFVRHVPLRYLAPLTDKSPVPGVETIFGSTDVFHAGPFLVPAGRKAAVVSTIYDLTPIRFPEFHLASNLFNARQLARRLERAELVIVPSISTGQDLERFEIAPKSKVRVVPLAADEFFKPTENRDLSQLSRLGLDREYLLNVGALEPRKNLPRLLEAYRLLRDRYHIPHKLVIAGPRGWKDQEIFESVSRLGLTDMVVFTGYVSLERLRLLYNHAVLLIYPSLYEGFGLPPLEAMASGCPVAVSETSSLPEVVGNAGVYFNPSEVEDIARAIREILESDELRAKLIRLGQRQSEEFSWEKTAAATREIYREALKKNI